MSGIYITTSLPDTLYILVNDRLQISSYANHANSLVSLIIYRIKTTIFRLLSFFGDSDAASPYKR